MDPIATLGLLASIVQLVEATTKAVQYLNDVKSAPKHRARLAREATNLLSLLTDLRYRVEEADSNDAWSAGIHSLSAIHGPLELLKDDMEALARKLEPKAQWKQAVLWPLDEKDVIKTLANIERMKTFVGLALQKDHFALSLAVREQNLQISSQMNDVVNAIRETRLEKKVEDRQAVIAWLSSLNFAPHQADTVSRRQPGTGKWFLETETFKSWVDGAIRSLWCPGPPGAGKTVMTSIVVEYLEDRSRKDGSIAIGYVYCNYKEQQTANALFSSLLQQLVRAREDVSNEVLAAYNRHDSSQTRPYLDEVCTMLRHEIEALPKVFLIVDALDECSEGMRDVMAANLMDLPQNAYLLVTSRPLPTIERDYEFGARLEIRATDEDVQRYVGARVLQSRRMVRHIEGDMALKTEIIDVLVANANGMFLLAQLHMDSLAKKLTKRDLRLALQRMPESLDEIYDEAMERIYQQEADDVQLARRALSWITHAFRPLTIPELRYALATASGIELLDEEALPYEDDIVSVCAGLVNVEEESKIIRLVHYTTQEYFERTRSRHFPTAQIEIAKNCLSYLSFIDHATKTVLEISRENPLVTYASNFWGRHAQGNEELQIRDQFLEFLKRSVPLDLLVRIVGKEHEHSQFKYLKHAFNFKKQGSALLVCACYGLNRIAFSLLNEMGIEVREEKGAIEVIHVAACNGNVEMVCHLIESGADIEAQATSSSGSFRPLGGAASYGHEHVVRLLLEKGANVDEEDDDVDPPLNLACYHNNSSMIQVLLDHGARIEGKDSLALTPLSYAVAKGNDTVIQTLLDNGANIEARDVMGRTPLILSAQRRERPVCGLLLEAGSDVKAMDRDGNTAFQTAIVFDNLEGTKIFLDHGVDLRFKNRNGFTAVATCIMYDRTDILRLIIENGVKEEDYSQDQWPELQYSIGLGAILTAVYGYKSPLHVHEKKFLEAMKDKGALDKRGAIGQSPLHWALIAWKNYGQDSWAKKLIAEGACLDATDDGGQTALHYAAADGNVAAVKVLLEAGASTELKDDHGRNVLQTARYSRSPRSDDVIEQLLRVKGEAVDDKLPEGTA